MKKHILVFFSVLILMAIPARVIYLEELKYSKPTPIPKNYSPILESSHINPPLPILEVNDKPLFLHFFNPECSCTKFNTEHFAEIARNFKDRVDFVIIIQDESNFKKDFFSKWGLSLPYIKDIGGKIAKAYGVYSTPQAVILDSNGKLYYRGNYNRSRFCGLKDSEYARIALESLIREEKLPSLPSLAKIAYGCELPSKTMNDKKTKFLDEFFNIY
ncbi:MAG: redoxin domain-containing protein [Leptospiraceae bacterium]|nr:redoxin domain-containing protein [Leptospiraceae bacterium]